MERVDLTPEQMEMINNCKTPEEVLALAREEGMELTTDVLDAISGGGPAWFDVDPIKRRFGYRRVYTEPAFDLDLDLEKESAREHGHERGADKRIRLSGDRWYRCQPPSVRSDFAVSSDRRLSPTRTDWV